jgi:hypothetical protein
MMMNRRHFTFAACGALAALGMPRTARADRVHTPQSVLCNWYKLVLKLVRHTPTYSPPVASRSFAYLGITAFEAAAGGSEELRSLSGQLNGLTDVPRRETVQTHDEALVIHAALALAVRNFFGNTSPTGQRVMKKFEEKLYAELSRGLDAQVIARSVAQGRAVAAHVLEWSKNDGGAVVENMGFPYEYELTKGEGKWVPTSLVVQQQKPLLPLWGQNRTFAMASGAACPLPEPPVYSEDKSSEFYRQALEVYDTTRALTDEQKTIARFWSDDPMLSPTPPGHWISIAIHILERDKAGLALTADTLARLGIAVSDAFVACWHAKFEFDLVRPVTYIRKHIDPKWEPMLITPPFPEYPSGHSTQSGAAADVLTSLFGGTLAFGDSTHARDGMAERTFPNFWAAAEEAGISRLYGGIHFRAAIDRGLDQGRCVASHVNALRTRT